MRNSRSGKTINANFFGKTHIWCTKRFSKMKLNFRHPKLSVCIIHLFLINLVSAFEPCMLFLFFFHLNFNFIPVKQKWSFSNRFRNQHASNIFDDAMRRRTFVNHPCEWGEQHVVYVCEELFSPNISYHKTIESGEFISLGMVWCDNGVREQIKRYCLFFCYLFIQSEETTGGKNQQKLI